MLSLKLNHVTKRAPGEMVIELHIWSFYCMVPWLMNNVNVAIKGPVSLEINSAAGNLGSTISLYHRLQQHVVQSGNATATYNDTVM